MKEITERQKEVLTFISDSTEENSYPPTVREIATHFDISIRAVQDHITALQKKGYLTQSQKRSRSFKVLSDVRKKEFQFWEQLQLVSHCFLKKILTGM